MTIFAPVTVRTHPRPANPATRGSSSRYVTPTGSARGIISAVVTGEQFDQIDRMADQMGISRSAVVRRAVAEWLAIHGGFGAGVRVEREAG